MRRYAIRYSLEFFVIFLGVLVSFSVQRYGEEKRSQQETRRLIYTLTTEIESNLEYCEEHLKQLRNMAKVNDAVLAEERLDRDFLIAQHNTPLWAQLSRWWGIPLLDNAGGLSRATLLDGDLVEHLCSERNLFQLAGCIGSAAEHRGAGVARIHRGCIHDKKEARYSQ